ncbi:MAG: hypothetical protein GEU83_16725 [Pseudonocardiaceae bacterium]|nr:hypothetical protein [Pseudonocardiaceae bacterium]
MIVDCDRCVVRGDACQDCVITVLLGAPPGGVEIDRTEAMALETLATAGMVPRLQLVNSDKRHSGRVAVEHGDQRPHARRSADCDERSPRRVG